MKRRFRQKQSPAPKDDPEKNNDLSEDHARENVNIEDVIKEIDTYFETHPDASKEE